MLVVAGKDVQSWLAETAKYLLDELPEGSEVIWVRVRPHYASGPSGDAVPLRSLMCNAPTCRCTLA